MSRFEQLAEALNDPNAFVEHIKELKSGDIANMIEKWKFSDFTKAAIQSDSFATIVGALDGDAITILTRKISPTGAKFRPGEKSRFAVVGTTNMRRRSEFMVLLVAMISYIYRALEERARADASDHYDLYFDSLQHRLIKSFLDELFEYNPSTSIDRFTSELHKPNVGEAHKHKIKSKTTETDILATSTWTKDRTKKYSKSENKYKEKERLLAQMTFIGTDDIAQGIAPITVKVDPPADVYPRFFNYFNSHWDGILKTTAALFEETDGSSRMEQNPIIFEDVRTFAALTPPDGDISKITEARLIAHKRLPMFSAQWMNTITVVSPNDGRLFETEEEAIAELQRHKGSTIQELHVIPTDAPILVDSWYAGRRKIVTDDVATNALFQRQEEAQRLYTQLNKRRVEHAKLRDIIMNGPDADSFAEYMRDINPDFGKQALDEQDEDEIMRLYHEFKATNVFYQRDDVGFMEFATRQFPGRDLARQPMSYDEQKRVSRAYAESFDVLELPQDSEHIALDVLELGGTDPSIAGPLKRREYVPTPDGMSLGAVRGMGK
jgi:hypothetical protein